MNDQNIHVECLSGSKSVIAAASANNPWDVISGDVKIKGVVDADYRADSELTSLKKNGIYVLRYHEVESVFCDPDLIFDFTHMLFAENKCPQKSEIIERYVNMLRPNVFKIAIARSVERARCKLGVSGFSAAESANIKSNEGAETLWLDKREAVKSQVEIAYDGDILKQEIVALQNAIEEKDIKMLLQLIPGKDLYEAAKSFYRTATNDAESILMLFKKHDPEASHAVFAKIRSDILSMFDD